MSTKKRKKKRRRKKPESTMFLRLGEYLKRERELKGLTQNEVGDAMGFVGSRISAIETGKGNPGIENLGRWLEALGLSPAAFGWRYERFCQGQTLEPMRSEAHLKEIVRSLLGEVLQELSGLVLETGAKKEKHEKKEPGEQGR